MRHEPEILQEHIELQPWPEGPERKGQNPE
jgi:hypothetical protein